MKPIKAEESIGQKYGQLTVLEFVGEHITPNGRKFKRVRCLCDCGKEKIANLQDIRCGKTKTCGLNHPTYVDRTTPAFNQLYNHTYKQRAINKGLTFDISKEDFKKMTQMVCHYCGQPPKNTMIRCKSGNTFSEYVYNGIDRKDNKLGYFEDNIVPCCSICNHAKHVLSYDVFVDWLDKIVKFRGA